MSDIVGKIADMMERQEALFKEKEKKYKEKIEDAYRRGKAEGYRQAILEYDVIRATNPGDEVRFHSGTIKCLQSGTGVLTEPFFDISTANDMKSRILVSAIVGMCRELDYCPSIIGWEDHPGCGGRPELCEGCWKKAREKFEHGKDKYSIKNNGTISVKNTNDIERNTI